ncbi:CMGC/DYRK/PRP4 protein kinase, variant 1 [Aphanomyces invadans]|uniref:CMGC/DYRK/PRP4 protein kinase, variant 1 n=2 Tax=Aphanomyces invadans TaxID=157072 RepID=A0A024TFA8_9STRA|nr:CMGC/DYRK/PRP4 protein kinase, variant 1 [Aphanomyces invadans]ETV92728.1 CMGC/DYRK/PRP4 protein kinase, variant 1 [Aphanomyces invadans]|eukprot:XP_008878763.1 CMGC/DYRK/PRP4 protein kinase, variant 1 [Aphanomyces invadans]
MAEDRVRSRRRRSVSRSPNRQHRGRRDRSSSREKRHRPDDDRRRRDSKKRKLSRTSRSRSRGKHRISASRRDHDKDEKSSPLKKDASATNVDVKSDKPAIPTTLPDAAPSTTPFPDTKPKKTSRFSDKKESRPSFDNDELANAPSVVASVAPKQATFTPAVTTTTTGTPASKESVKGTISDIFRIDNVVPTATNKSLSKPGALSIVLGGPVQRRQSSSAAKGPETSSPLLSSKPPPPPLQQATSVKPAPPPRPLGDTAKPPPPPLTSNMKPPPPRIIASVAAPSSPRPLNQTPATTSVPSPSKASTAATSSMESPPVPKVAIDVESMKNNILKALAAAKSLAASKIAAPVAPDADIEPQVDAIESRHDDDTTGVLELRKSAKPKASSSSTDALSTQEISDEQHGAETSEAVSASISPAHDDQGSTIQKAVSPKRSPAVAPKPVPTVDQPVEFDMFALDDNDEDDGRVSDSDSYREKSSLRPAVLALERHGNHDDSEGYYKANIGEVLNGEYRVMGTMGKGVFSSVLLCKQMKDDTTVAVKLIRNNDTMRDAAQLEVRLLTELQTGPRRSKYVVRLLNSFEFRSHAAMVFEPMQMNVREAMKKFGGRDGLALGGVKVFCRQLVLALDHLQTCSIVHADIKPDNMLLDDKQSMVKLCDFGSAFKVGVGEVNDPTPYLVSRYYRAPEAGSRPS